LTHSPLAVYKERLVRLQRQVPHRSVVITAQFLQPQVQRSQAAYTFDPSPMTRSGTNLFTGKVLLPGRVISGLSTTSKPKDDEEEREHLVAGESSASHSLRHQSPPPQLKARNPPAIPPSQHYAHVAREFMSSLSHLRRLLGPEDVKLTDKHPAAAGRFADVWQATHGGYKVVLKAHRCYATSDITRVAAVRCDHLCRTHG